LFERVLAELPRERYRVVGALHPQIWSHHGSWQVRTWLADCLRAGLDLVPPQEGWRGALVAADQVIGDYGSSTGFGAGLGVPVLLATNYTGPLLPGSPTAILAECAPVWRFDTPLVGQLHDRAAPWVTEAQEKVSAALTSCPGRTGAILRRTMYRLLGLAEPNRAVPVSPVPLPTLVPW
jgi:hypothetical protein